MNPCCSSRLTKHLGRGLVLNIGQEMAVTLPHFFSGVTNKIIDDPLVNACVCQVADEGVAKAVPAFGWCPATFFKCVDELGLDLAADDLMNATETVGGCECESGAWVILEPAFNGRQQLFANRYAAC